jgi:hypothetical protein
VVATGASLGIATDFKRDFSLSKDQLFLKLISYGAKSVDSQAGLLKARKPKSSEK